LHPLTSKGGAFVLKLGLVFKKRSNFCLPKVASFFIQAAGLVYHQPKAVKLWFDDMQGFALICMQKSDIICSKMGVFRTSIHIFSKGY